MSTPSTPFTDVYTKWLESVRALIPGAGPGPAAEKKAEVIAKQEWEDEGGAPRVVPPAKTKGAPRLPSRKAAPKTRIPSKPGKSAAKAGRKRSRR
jgi:hypothetical protein